MRFVALAKVLARLESTSSRNEITAILAELFRRASAGEIAQICYLSLGELLPAYRGLEFNLAERMMLRVAVRVFGRSEEEINRRYRQRGDLGDLVFELAAAAPRSSKLSVAGVYGRLLAVAEEEGEGSQERKIQKMSALWAELDPLSLKFVARIPLGKLRLGFSDLTVLDALSVMERGDKSARKMIEAAYNVTADIGDICRRVKVGGLKNLTRLQIVPGVPVRPSLADRLGSPEEIIKKLGPEVAVEPKFDGFRTELHLWREDGEKRTRLFSRNLENTTAMFPEIVADLKTLGAESAVLDGEAIGYDPQTGRFSPFQETVRRKRKHQVEEVAKRVPLRVFVFDLLYLNGRSFVGLSFADRRRQLEKLLSGKAPGVIGLVEQRLATEARAVKDELDRALNRGLEGVVIKKLDAAYEAGSRGFHWVKLKAKTAALGRARDGRQGPLDTIDCLVMGVFAGRGKRAAFGVGGFLLGVRGGDGRFFSLSKLGSGLSDDQFKEARRRIRSLAVKERPREYFIDPEIAPDTWLEPALVVEVLADEITLSPRHTAGRREGRGFSLRFPRMVRFRDDKHPTDVTTVKEVEKLYLTQTGGGA